MCNKNYDDQYEYISKGEKADFPNRQENIS